MSLWSTLAKIGGGIAAPFTGGASLALTGLGAAGDIAGGMAGGRAKGRADQADFNLRSGQAQQAANVGTADVNARAHAKALSDALHGTLLQHATDASVSGLPYGVNKPTITGGLRPSALGGADERYELGRMQRDPAVTLLRNTPQATPMNPVNFNNLAPKPSGLDKFLNILGTSGAFAGALAPAFKKGARSPYDTATTE